MKFDPTPSQRAAIEAKDRTLLLSAAAGSGKTATLTQRIIKSLTDENDPADISRMLIVTFTRAAAAELRERITAALSEALQNDPSNPHLNRQALLVGSADICTIDSFCLDVVKRNFQKLKLDDGSPVPPDFRMADTTELAALRISVMNSLIDEWYDKPSGELDFAAFAQNFAGTRDDGDIVETLIKFSEMTALYKNGATFSSDCADGLFAAAEKNEFFGSAPGEVIKALTRDTLQYYERILSDAIDYLRPIPKADANYIPAFADDLAVCRSALSNIDCYSSVRDELFAYDPKKLKTLGKNADAYTSYYKAMRDKIKKGLLALRASYYSFDPEMLTEYMKKTAQNVKILGLFIDDYRRRTAHEKALRKICDFSDIKQLAYRLLVDPDGLPTETALNMREKYDAVYIDEYQDVDPLQDAIFAAVARPDGRFMVGDIKQSIYGFRGSDPSIFGKYRLGFTPFEKAAEGEDSSIFMSENFRCNKPVIDFTNLVSRSTFAAANGAVAYSAEDDLINGKSGGSEPVRLAFFLPPEKDEEQPDLEIQNSEIRYVVNEIASLIDSARKDNGEPIKPGDIAVLTRSSSLGAAIADALSRAKIPATDAVTKDFFENPEILLILSLVSTVDNPHRDVRLAATLRSPLFGFSMDDLVRIRHSADSSYSLYEALELYSGENELKEKCASFTARLEKLRARAYSLPVDRFVHELFSEFTLTALELSDDPRTPEQIRENILRFYEYAREFAKRRDGGDISSFVKYIDDIIFAGVKTETESESSPDKVSIMTVHKSKGLEFPVVFLCGCGKAFNRDGLSAGMLYDPDCGIGMQITDETGFARVDTPIRTAIARAITERELEEEMRILYVALTRARERLYVTAKLTKTAWESAQADIDPQKYLCRYSALSATGFIDWLLPIALSGDDSFELSVLSPADIPDIPKKNKGSAQSTGSSDSEGIAELENVFKARFEKEYAYKASLSLPAKLSVSKLYPTVLDDDGAAGLDEDSLPELIAKPLFMLEKGEERSRATAAERGTATHVFLQFCDFERAEKFGIRSELDRLESEKFISPATAELVNVSQLEAFFKSRLYRSVKGASRVFREQRFNLLLPANKFTKDEALGIALAEDELLVQGVIDLVFEDKNGDITLCDYKTDHLTRAELADPTLAQKKLAERHGEQLHYYAEAVKELFGKEPARICIYSLPLGDTVEME